MESKINDTNELIYKTESHRHRKETYIYQRGKGGRDESGVWDENIHSTIYKINNQQLLQGQSALTQKHPPALGKTSETPFVTSDGPLPAISSLQWRPIKNDLCSESQVTGCWSWKAPRGSRSPSSSIHLEETSLQAGQPRPDHDPLEPEAGFQMPRGFSPSPGSS